MDKKKHTTEAAPKKSMSLARKAGIFTVSRAITIIAQLAASMILARAISKEEQAPLIYLLLIYATVQMFGQLGLPDSVFYFFEKLPANARKSFAWLLTKTLFALSLIGLVAMPVAAWLGSTKEGFSDVNTLVWMFVAMLVFELPSLPLPNILIALDKAKSAAWLNIFTGLAQFSAMTLPLLADDPIPLIIMGLMIYAFLRLVVSAVVFYQNFKQETLVPLPPGMLKEVFIYSLPLSLAQLFWGLNREFDKFAVQWFLPAAVYVEYSYGARELPIVPTIAYSVAAVMMPRLVGHFLKKEKEPLLQLWLTSIRKVTIIVLPLVVFFILAADEFITLLFTEDYKGAALPFQIYTFILLQRVASYSNMQKALGDTKTITRGAAYLFLINAVLCVPFLFMFGVAGPPLASLVAQTFSWWYALNVIRKLIDVDFSEVFPFRFYGKALLVAAAAAVPFYILKKQWDLPVGLAFMALAAGYFLMYLLLARASGVIGEEDFRRVFKKKV